MKAAKLRLRASTRRGCEMLLVASMLWPAVEVDAHVGIAASQQNLLAITALTGISCSKVCFSTKPLDGRFDGVLHEKRCIDVDPGGDHLLVARSRQQLTNGKSDTAVR